MNKHSIPVTVKSVFFPDSFAVSRKDFFASRKCRYQHKKCGFREVKIGNHAIYCSKPVSRIYKKITISGSIFHGSGIIRSVFECSDGCCAHGNDPSSLHFFWLIASAAFFEMKYLSECILCSLISSTRMGKNVP